jgi:REP element-mobilizing transposase RayT
MNKVNSKLPNRRSIRLRKYDYNKPGAYFVTICTDNRACDFGEIDSMGMNLNELGNQVLSVWNELPDHYPSVKLDVFVIMPNHIHGILNLSESTVSLSEVVRAFKTFSSRKANEKNASPGKPLWQRGFYEHVIRNEDDLFQMRQYILNNPLKWELDRENPKNRAGLKPAPTNI